MTEPKKVYLPDPQNMLIWNESTNEVTNRKFTYHSDTHLKEWIEENTVVYIPPKGSKQPYKRMIDPDELLKYLNEQ